MALTSIKMNFQVEHSDKRNTCKMITYYNGCKLYEFFNYSSIRDMKKARKKLIKRVRLLRSTII